jgi:hypothetical protein
VYKNQVYGKRDGADDGEWPGGSLDKTRISSVAFQVHFVLEIIERQVMLAAFKKLQKLYDIPSPSFFFHVLDDGKRR